MLASQEGIAGASAGTLQRAADAAGTLRQASSGLSGRLRSIDALRGVAALGVVMFHARAAVSLVPSRWFDAFLNGVLFFGRYGVWLFFVISGFCIHLRWAKEQQAVLSPHIDFRTFWKRRFRRLYPPYLFAFFLYVACLMAEGLSWTPSKLREIGLNLVMLSNVNQGAADAVNGVFWTLAVEEQLYLAYFLLVRWRVRFGWAVTLACCFAIRAAWFALALLVYRTTGAQLLVVQAAASQWIIWALGALSVEVALGLSTVPAWCRNGWIGTAILLVTGGTTYAYAFWRWGGSDTAYSTALLPAGWLDQGCWFISDLLWGVGFFVWVNAAVAVERRWGVRAHVPRLVLYCST